MTEAIDPMKIEEVKKRTLLSKTTIYRMMDKGRFPKQIRISDNTVVWNRFEVERWFSERAAAREVR
ncbi:MAG: AlpA family phage regulatory protein [Novosphingobium sp.]|uniref:helix-turn-helix transcriptional regulator n=1 Tax=Novosphingobium sp. TaxID=1874826 RepID=UPI0022BCEC9B|nr:AlpA family phage regulatory protein [Novosphingobium sp.]MCZ8036374.1 AlpA family phage regulatory protein [Novosphingobium sp.]